MDTDKKSSGALVGSIIIIIILIAGGIYIWQSGIEKAIEQKETQNFVVPMDANELNALEESLNATDIDTDFDVSDVK